MERYRLWRLPEKRPQSGHYLRSAAERAKTTITPSSSAAFSKANPAGTRDDKRRMLAIVLIPSVKQHQSGMQNHQMRVRPEFVRCQRSGTEQYR
jgi:hypothetical protein